MISLHPHRGRSQTFWCLRPLDQWPFLPRSSGGDTCVLTATPSALCSRTSMLPLGACWAQAVGKQEVLEFMRLGAAQSSATVQPRDSRPSPSRSVGVALRLAPEALSLLPTAGRTCWPAPPPQLLGPLPPKLSAPESVGFQGDSKQSHAPAQEKCSLAHTVISYGNCAKSTAPFTSPTLGFSQARQVPLLWRGLR